VRIRERIKRLMSPECHAEYPHSRTRRMIGNVRITGTDGDLVTVAANFICHRYRRYERVREYVGSYRHILKRDGDRLLIKERRVIIDAHELGSLGSSASFYNLTTVGETMTDLKTLIDGTRHRKPHLSTRRWSMPSVMSACVIRRIRRSSCCRAGARRS